MARWMLLALCGMALMALTACSVASAQGPLDATRTAIARESAALQQTRAALDIGLTQTALVNERATLNARMTTPATSATYETLTLQSPAQHPITVFVRGVDGFLYYKVYHNGAWADWKSLQPPVVGITYDSPSAVVQDDSRIDLFVRGQDGALWHAVFDGVRWSNWESLGGRLTSGPGAVVAP